MNASGLLDYPFGAAPDPGASLAVRPGLAWLRRPLRSLFSTAHINLWMADDGEGRALFDSGLLDEDTVEFWASWHSDPASPRISRVFVTHMHPDHAGMAGWLARTFQCRLWMTELEYLSCRVHQTSHSGDIPEHQDFYRQAGWPGGQIDSLSRRSGGLYRHTAPLPASYRRIDDDEQVEIGGNTWRVVVGTGHSPAHACFYSERHGVLISSDQVLPRISSNVSVGAMEPDANPLAGWLHTLQRLASEIPADTLVLPAHGAPFLGLHQRLAHLAAQRQRALDRLRQRLCRPCRAVDVLDALFRPPPEDPPADRWRSLATGAALAHLNYLLSAGEISRHIEQGIAWYQLR